MPLGRRTFVHHLVAAGAASLTPTGLAAAQTPSPRDVLDTYFRAVQARDLDRVSDLFAQDARYEDATFQAQFEGRDAIRQMFEAMFHGLAEPTYQLIRSVAEADRVAAEWSVEGRHAGPMLGVEASGRRMRIRGVSLLEIRRGKIRSVTDYIDRAGLETQLGLRKA